MCYIDSIWFNTCDNQFKSLLNLKYNRTSDVYNAEYVSFDINDILLNMKTKTIHSFIWPVIWSSYSIHIHIYRDIEVYFNAQWRPTWALYSLRTTKAKGWIRLRIFWYYHSLKWSLLRLCTCYMFTSSMRKRSPVPVLVKLISHSISNLMQIIITHYQCSIRQNGSVTLTSVDKLEVGDWWHIPIPHSKFFL